MHVRHARSFALSLLVSGTALLAAPDATAQLQPTTNVVVTTSLNATGPNVAAARLRRPTTDALGRAHIGVFIMHPYSSYQNNALCNGLAQRGFTVICADGTFTG